MNYNRETEDKQLFDNIADNYVRKDLIEYCRIARKLRLDQTIKNVAKPIENILEVGCGAGFSADYLKSAYQHFTGLDYSQNLISYAERHKSYDNVKFVCENIKDYNSMEKFKVILMIGVLHHITEPEEVLLHLKKLLDEDGLVIVNEPQKGNPVIGIMRKIRKLIDSKYSSDQVEFSANELKKMFEKCGYETKVFSQGFFSTPLAETRLFPNILGVPFAMISKWLDLLLENIFSSSILCSFSWNIVVEARLK